MNQLDPYLLPPEGTPPQPATTGQNWTHKKRPPLASELQRTGAEKIKNPICTIVQGKREKNNGKIN